jgi:hypothetical protein
MGDPEPHRHRVTRHRNNTSGMDVNADESTITHGTHNKRGYQVFDEGSHVVLDDGEGHVEVRRVSVGGALGQSV